MKVLLVDDDFYLKNHFEAYLNSCGAGDLYELSAVYNVTDALQLLEKERFDLILLDQKLPDYNGLDAYRTVKRKSKNARIVLCTNYNTEDLRAESPVLVVSKSLIGPDTICGYFNEWLSYA